MDYRIKTDESIILDLAAKFEALRIRKRIKDTDIEKAGGISRKILYNFRKGTSAITLKSFIRLLRGIDELDRLQKLFEEIREYSPLEGPEKELPKRVRDPIKEKEAFKWGDED